MYRRLLYIVMVMCVLALPGTLAAHTQPSYYWHWKDMPSEELLKQGIEFGNNEVIDSAVQCFTILTSRPNTSDSILDKAHVNLAKLYLFQFYNFPKALSHLKKAEQIEKRSGIVNPQTYLTFHGLFQGINNNLNDPSYDTLIMDYGRKAFLTAHNTDNELALGLAFINLIASAIPQHKVATLKDLFNIYQSYQPKSKPSLHLIGYNFYHAAMALENKQWQDAIEAFTKMQKAIPDQYEGYNLERIHLMILDNLSFIYHETGQDDKALKTLKEMEQVSMKNDVKDGLLLCYDRYSIIFHDAQDNSRYMNYALKHMALKDTLLSYQQTMQLSKVEFESELSDMELQLAQLNHRHQMMLVTSILCGIIALLVLGLGYFIHRRNRQLSARNQALYDKNQQLIVANKHERMTREQLEELLEQTRREQAEALAAVSQQELVDNDDTEEPKGEPVKYKDSRLTELDKNRLQGLIQKVLDTPDVICDPDFTVMQLAALIGARQREVSQVIGERYGANFNIVVNDHRVKEACRRIQDEPRFLQNTIEAMAGEVGIRSRNTFTQAFKRVTGMNPSEYIRRARTR